MPDIPDVLFNLVVYPLTLVGLVAILTWFYRLLRYGRSNLLNHSQVSLGATLALGAVLLVLLAIPVDPRSSHFLLLRLSVVVIGARELIKNKQALYTWLEGKLKQ